MTESVEARLSALEERLLEERIFALEERIEAVEELFEELAAKVEDGAGAPVVVSKYVADNRAAFEMAYHDVSTWFKENCERVHGYRTTSRDLYDDYRHWCRERGHEPLMPPTSSIFSQILRAHVVIRYRTANDRGFVGVRLRDPS